MKKIVSIVQPFDLKQTVIAYENGNKINATQIETLKLAECICEMAKTLDINEIELGGSRKYVQGIGQKIETIAISQYDLNNLVINYL